MKHLFVSDERLIQQQYRRGIIFRLTGVLILFATFLQLPALLLAGLSWKRHHDEESTRNELRAEVNNLQKANTPLNDVRRKLDQIRQWEPILRNRLPISALLHAIENSMPANAVLDSIAIESEQFERVPVPGGVFRVPGSYRLVLQGLERLGEGDAVQTLAEAFQKCLPSRSELVHTDRSEKRADGFVQFSLQYSIKPDGNYFGLGVRKISEPDTL
jgi:hypothetical protein